MALIKISALPAAATGQTTDIHVVVQGGVTSRQTTQQLLAPITTAYTAADLVLTNAVAALQTSKADLASPALTGTPTAPTAGAGTSTTQIATTAFVTTADLLRLRLSGVDLMTGNLQMNNNKITGLTAGSTGTSEGANVTQVETLLLAKPSTLTDYNPTITSAFPTTGPLGTIRKGDRYYITAIGTMASGTVSVRVGDIIEARINSAANSSADWAVRGGGVSTVTATSPLASSGGSTPNITLSSVPISLGGTGQTSLGTSGQFLRVNAGATGTEWATVAGTGTVTSVTSVPGDGVTINISNPTTTPLLTVDLGNITPSAINGNTISTGTGTLSLSSFTLTVSGNGSISGTNTGDQLNIAGNANTATNLANGTAGQIAYQTAANTTTFLAVGTNGHILTLSGGLPVWAAPSGGSVTSVTASSPLASSGGTTPNITLSTAVPVTLGGTGLTSISANRIPYATGANTIGTIANFMFDGTSMGIGISSPSTTLDVRQSANGPMGIQTVNGSAGTGATSRVRAYADTGFATTDIESYGSGYITAGLLTANVSHLVLGPSSGAIGLISSTEDLVLASDGTGTTAERLRLDTLGNVSIGTAALGTTATDGFLYIPTCAGLPTGVPTAKTGRAPIVYDSTNNKLMIYDGGWIGVTVS